MDKKKDLSISSAVLTLLERGVVIPSPFSVDVDPSLDPERIAPGAVIKAGCRIMGSSTSIGPDSVLGEEAPATLDNCQVGRGVRLQGGYFSGSVFLDGAKMGSGAQVRPGCLLEEQSSGAHSVGFKQTILFPFVTVGSLINFCDCLMAGGTGRRNHSEVGSSYIHFNFTPHGDKATPSLIGDVPRGVILDKPPIFLGGQGGIVGPVRLGYGSVIPAGVIHRGDVLEEGLLVMPGQAGQKGSRPYRMGVYRKIDRIIKNNLIYIGNIRALQAWYGLARAGIMDRDPFSGFLLEGARKVIGMILDERIRRLGELVSKLAHSVKCLLEDDAGEGLSREIQGQQSFIDGWPAMEAVLREGPGGETGSEDRDAFLSAWEKASAGSGYLETLSKLSPGARRQATGWLQSLVDSVAAAGPDN